MKRSSSPISDQNIMSSPNEQILNLRDPNDPHLTGGQASDQAPSVVLETIVQEGVSPLITRGGLRDLPQQQSMWSEEATRDPPRPALSSHIRQSTRASAAFPEHDIDEVQQSLQNFKYKGEEDNIICGQFPHLTYNQRNVNLNDVKLIQVFPGIFMGPLEAAFKTKELIDSKVTHILNCSCHEYTKRSKFFKYLNIEIYDTTKEDAFRHFRITNRFIHQARKENKVLVHSVQGKSRAPTFILAYLIAKHKIKLKDGLALLRKKVPEIEPNDFFFKQLNDYDLQCLSRY